MTSIWTRQELQEEITIYENMTEDDLLELLTAFMPESVEGWLALGVIICAIVAAALRRLTQGITPVVQGIGVWISENPRLTQGLMLLGGAFVALKAGALAFTVLASARKSFGAGLAVMSGQAQSCTASIRGAFGRMRMELGRPVAVSFGQAAASVTGFRNRLASLAASARRTAGSLRQIGPASVMAGARAVAAGAMASTARVGFNALRLGVRGVGLAFKTMFGPATIVMTAISLGAEYIMEHWDVIQPYFEALWEGVKTVFNSVVGWIKPVFDKIMGFISPLISGVKTVADIVGKGWDALFGGDEKKPAAAQAAPEPLPPQAAPMPLSEAEQAQAEAYANGGKPPAKKKKAGKSRKSARKKQTEFERQAAMLEELGDDYGENPGDFEPDDILPAAPPPSRGKGGKAGPGKTGAAARETLQPLVQVELSVTQNGVPDAEFATGVINALKSRQADLEAMISGIVSEQARLAYGG